jgi:hypothetical protein
MQGPLARYACARAGSVVVYLPERTWVEFTGDAGAASALMRARAGSVVVCDFRIGTRLSSAPTLTSVVSTADWGGKLSSENNEVHLKQTGIFQLDWGWLFEGCLAFRVR